MATVISFDAASRQSSVPIPKHRPYLACLHRSLAFARKHVRDLEKELAAYSDEAEAEIDGLIKSALPDILSARGLR